MGMIKSIPAEDKEDGSRLVFVCDLECEPRAAALAKLLSLPLLRLAEICDGGLGRGVDVIVDANLRNFATVDALRLAFGRARGADRRCFVIEDGPDLRLWRIQADALGASRHVLRQSALAELRQLVGMGFGQQPEARRDAALSRRAGGAGILEAGRSLGRLFDGLLADTPISMTDVSTGSLDLFNSVKAVGVGRWVTTVRDHHEGTFQHCLLVTGIAASYAQRLNLSQGMAVTLTNAAMLHDIGKAVIPRHVLDKPGALTDAEFELIKQHPGAGFDYLGKQGGMTPAILDAVRHHHEALDGSGYPDGLRAAEITPLTRVLTVCDIMAALIEARPYKETRTPPQAVSILVDMAILSKVDYDVVRNLAGCFEVSLPDSLEEVVAGVNGSKATAA